jgi:hypothetical protein
MLACGEVTDEPMVGGGIARLVARPGVPLRVRQDDGRVRVGRQGGTGDEAHLLEAHLGEGRPPGEQETVARVVLEYDDDGELGCRGYRFDVKHHIHWPKGNTAFEVSGPDGGKVFVMKFVEGDRMERGRGREGEAQGVRPEEEVQ